MAKPKTAAGRGKNKGTEPKTRHRSAKPEKPIKAAASAPKGGPTDDARAISKANFDKLIKSYRILKNDAAEASGQVGGLVSNYAENFKLHKKAFAMVKTLDRLRENPVALSELLFHFDVMREHGGYDKIAAPDMLPDRNVEKNVKRRSGKDAAAEQGAEDSEPTVGGDDDGPAMAGKTDFGGDNPFREIAEAGDTVIAEAERRLN